MKNIQSEDFEVSDETKLLFQDVSKKLTKMVNMAMGIRNLEINFLVIDGLGFWDVCYKTDDELQKKRWSVDEITPELVP